MTEAKHGTARVTENAICTFCGCTCDDIKVRVEDGRVVEAERACARGLEWFQDQSVVKAPSIRVDGRAATLDEAIDAAAQMLHSARSPLVYGLVEASAEAQATAVGIADVVGAILDTPSSANRAARTRALQRSGISSATLGEIKNRADLFVLWDTDIERSHPRFLERFVRAEGLYVTGPRKLIEFVETGKRGSNGADRTMRTPPGYGFEVISALRALVQGQRLSADAEAVSGSLIDELPELAAELQGCSYGVWIYDPDSGSQRSDPETAAATLGLVAALGEHVPFALLELGGRGNARGAQSVITAQTGYPFAVSFAQGYPRFGPEEFTASTMLERGEVDAALIVGCDPSEHLPDEALRALEEQPSVRVDFRESVLARGSHVSIPVATYGLAAPATVYRMDGVALRARPALSTSLPSDADVLRRLADRLGALSSAGGAPS